jgi:2-oxoisovalerate dehydrogenase E1 component
MKVKEDLTVPKIFTIKDTDKAILEKWFYLLTLGRLIDEKAPNYLKQAIGWSYHAPYAGHDGIQLAIGQIFDRENDHLFPYYRDMLTNMSAGITAGAVTRFDAEADLVEHGGTAVLDAHVA